MPQHFADADHALQTGYLAGTLTKAGIECAMLRDEVGNYKPFIEIVIPETNEQPVRVIIQVMPGETEGAQDERADPSDRH